ncbi:hypothetical protein TYRP_005521 [Tyrophagus putrescentiae]|nr:hypothetical protein TYRP_005521 [Tyrophagus putrescentiae]
MDLVSVPLSRAGDEYALKLITPASAALNLNTICKPIHKHLCILIVIALHYFFLAAFLWMFFKGLQLYTLLMTVFDSHRPHRLTTYTLVAYGASALLVFVAALVDPLSYETSDHCWLRAELSAVGAGRFSGANALFFALAMSRHSRNESRSGMISANTAFAVYQKTKAQQQHQQSQLKVYPSQLTSSPSYSIVEHSCYTSIHVCVRTSFALVVVLGLTCTFGVLYLSRFSNVFMAYLFTVLNSLQGIFIFIACCLLNEKVRGEYRTMLARGARRCFFFRPFEGVFLSLSSGRGGISNSLGADGFITKSSTDSSTRSVNMMEQHLCMQQLAAFYQGSKNATGGGGSVKGGGRDNGSQLQSETATAASTPTADQPLIGSGNSQLTGAQSTIGLDQQQQQQQHQQQHHTLQHGAINSMHLPAIVRDSTLNGKMLHQHQQQQNCLAGHHQHQQQQTVALLDGTDTVRCCTLTDHKLCDHGSSGGHPSSATFTSGDDDKWRRWHLHDDCRPPHDEESRRCRWTPPPGQ